MPFKRNLQRYIMDAKAPRKMRRVVESTMLAYGLALVSIAVAA